MDYITCKPYSEESEIRRSRFIGEVIRVKSEEEMFSALASLRKKYQGATHICYAAVFDILGNQARFSDDGEPSGTAGQPILEALKGSGLKQTLIAVVRYFGGVKLGAGGLVRAYSSSASQALKNAPKVEAKCCDTYSLNLDFTLNKRAPSFFEKKGISVLSVSYAMDVEYRLAVPKGTEILNTLREFVGGEPKLMQLETQYIEQEI